MNITVYTKPLCGQCTATKRALDRAGITYKTVDLTEDPAALAEVKRRGFAQAPIVVTDDDAWSGFRPDRIKTLA